MSKRHYTEQNPKKTSDQICDTETVLSSDSDSTQYLEKAQKILDECLENSWHQQNMLIKVYGSKTENVLQALKTIPLHEEEEFDEVVLPVAGDVSAGKSSLLNALCKFPIIPAAEQTTSICPVEVRRCETMADERIEVCLYSDDRKSLNKKPIKKFERQEFSKELFQELIDYAKSLVDDLILSVNDTLDFFGEGDSFHVEKVNWRHTMFLLMILLDTYVQQDKQDSKELAGNYRRANITRNSLLDKLGIPKNKDYGIRLYWDSELIPKKAVIVDLPGTGSASSTENDQLGHTAIVANYTSMAPSLLFLFNEKALINPEAMSVIDSFLKPNELKMESSARVTFVMNRADMLNGKLNGAKISISSFRANYSQHYPSYAQYAVYGVSARAGEWLYLDSDIPIENLHVSRKEIQNALEDGEEPDLEKIRRRLQKNYERSYPYQLSDGDDFGEMSLPDFFREFFTDCVGRIRLLNSLAQATALMSTNKKIAEMLNQETTLYDAAKQFGAEVTGVIAEVIQKAVDESINQIRKKFTNLNRTMTEHIVEFATAKEKEVVYQFDRDYSDLNSYINAKIRNCVSGMRKNKNGTIPVGGNIAGGNEYGRKNLQEFRTMARSIAQIPFISYFRKSFTKLQEEFSSEKRMYDESIADVAEYLNAIPTIAVQIMEKEYRSTLENRKLLERKAMFDSAFENSKESTELLLRHVCDEMAEKLVADNAVQTAINRTSNAIQEGLMGILAPYTGDEYADKLLSRIKKSRWFRADTIETDKLTEVLKKYYLEDFEYSLKKMLERNFYDVGNTTNESHMGFMIDAIDGVVKKILARETTETMKQNVVSATSITKINLSNSDALSEWNQTMKKARGELGNFFGDGSLYCVLHEIQSNLCGEEWVASVLNAAIAMSEEAKTEADKTGRV